MENANTCACGCGKAIKSITANGRPRYYARGHGKTRLVEATCRRCGVGVRVGLWRLEKFGKVYCSPPCSGQAQRRPHQFTCDFCGIKFLTQRGRKQGKRVFCSYLCFSRAHEAEPDRKVDVQCCRCGKPFRVYPSKLKVSTRFYCDTVCRAEHIIGKGNPAYRSGTGRQAKYGPNWRRQRRAAVLRDDRCCQYCHKQPKSTRRLHVHHIRPFYEFEGDYLAANDLHNLLSLCITCHKKAESGKITVQAKLL